MHPVTRRLYEAVQALTGAATFPPPGRVASEANISHQTLNNWHERGPSAQGLLDFQLAHGVNATWLLTGYGPQMIDASRQRISAERNASYRVWPLSDELVDTLRRVDAETRRRLENSIRGQLDMPLLAGPPLVDSANRRSQTT